MFLIAEPIGRFVFRLDAPERPVMGMGAGFSNVVVIGLPLIAFAYGSDGLVPAILIVAFHSPVLISATTLLVEALQGRGEGSLRVAGAIFGSLLRNPIVVGVLVGLLWGAFGFGLPARSEE